EDGIEDLALLPVRLALTYQDGRLSDGVIRVQHEPAFVKCAGIVNQHAADRRGRAQDEALDGSEMEPPHIAALADDALDEGERIALQCEEAPDERQLADGRDHLRSAILRSRHRRALCGVAPSIWWRGSSACPWCKGVLDVPERGRQGGKVAQQNGGHAIRVDPVEPFWC